MTATTEPVNILLVDDMPEGLLSLEAVLGGLGQNLVKAHSGKEALREVLARDFAVILLDIQMPILNGFEVAQAIRGRQASAHIPIIFLTANNLAPVQMIQGYESGAVDYLCKPLDPVILRSKVAVFVELAKQTAQIKRQTAEIVRRERDALFHAQVEQKNQELLELNVQLEAALAAQQQVESTLELRNEELAQHRHHLEGLVAQRTAELERSNADLEQFANIASHDLQEPLRMVASYVALLAERYHGQLDEKADKYIHYAVDGAKRMHELINGLLAFSRVTQGAGEASLVSAALAMDDALANLQVAQRESKSVITRTELPSVWAKQALLWQVFQNLIGNAIKFRGDAPACIHVAAEQHGQQWIFSVQDQGIGFDVSHAEHIFVLFQRLNERGKYPGNGIGLAITKKIITSYGGRIWVESEPGKGATFFFSWPVAVPASALNEGDGP